MPFIAVCPYCRAGRVRAPESALGLTAPCPRCQVHFTLIDSGETLEEAKQRSGFRPRPDLAPATTPSAGRPGPAVATPPVDPAVRTAVAESTALDAMRLPDSVALPLPPATVDDARADPLRAPTLIAFILAGLALVAAQFPYGRFGTVGLAGVGLLIAGACWFGAHRPLLPAAATIVNAIVVIVALVLPNWIGLGAWRSGKPDWAPATGSGVKAFGPNGLESPGGEWIRGDYGWQLDDVRVRLPLLAVGPVELTGSQKRRSTRDYLQVQVRVQNVGVARTIAFNGWNVGPLAGNAAPRLVDSAGHVLPLATVEPGLEGLVRPTQAALASGRAADQLLLFEPPAGTFDYVRLELPGSAFGWTQAVRFQIAPSQIVKRSP